MTSTTPKAQPRPWHTASFYNARFTMLCLALLFCFLEGPVAFLPGAMIVLAFFDLVAIASGKGKGINLSPPATIPVERNEGEKQLLGWSLIAFAFCFVAILAIGFDLSRPASEHSLLIRLLIVAATNLAGWHLFAWLREAFVILRYYNLVAGGTETNPGVAPLPVLTGVLTCTQPTQQAQLLQLRVGTGATLRG